MPLTVREVLLVLRAKDQASRVIADVGRSFVAVGTDAEKAARKQIHAGQALLGVGVAMAATGAAGIAFLGSMVDDAVEYNRQAALTLTQVDQLGVSLEDVKDIARDVGAAIPVPFEQLQTALYDIFSSTNATLPQARILLEQFSMDAVAGQVDIQDAARSTIAIMNAYNRPLEEVTQVSDVMFQLVRKGIGTYEEFASTIGRAIPSAVRSGQSIENLAGMMAFLTRNGLSTAMASASAARALDSFSHPTVVNRLEKMGIAVRDQAGNFRNIDDVVVDLAKHVQSMSDPQRAEFLQELFKGAGGTIQARRFWDVALQNPEALVEFTNLMENAGGAAEEAYDIMFNQPVSQMQLLKNNWEILKTEIGDIVIPIFQKLVEWGVKIVKFFRELSPEAKKAIVMIIGFTSVGLLLLGILVAVAGALLLLNGALGLIGLSIGVVLPVFLGFLALVALLIIGLKWLYDNVPVVTNTFKGLGDVFQDVTGFLRELWDVFDNEGIGGVWDRIWNATFGSSNNFKNGIKIIREDLKLGFSDIWQDMQTGWDVIMTDFKTSWDDFWDDFVQGLKDISGWIDTAFNDYVWPALETAVLDLAPKAILAFAEGLGNAIQDLFWMFVDIGKQIAGDVARGFVDALLSIPLLGDVANALGLDRFGTNERGLPPEELRAPLSGLIRGAVIGPMMQGATIGSNEQGFMGSYDETTINVTGNTFEVADFNDLLEQLQQQIRLANKVDGGVKTGFDNAFARRQATVKGMAAGLTAGGAEAPASRNVDDSRPRGAAAIGRTLGVQGGVVSPPTRPPMERAINAGASAGIGTSGARGSDYGDVDFGF